MFIGRHFVRCTTLLKMFYLFNKISLFLINDSLNNELIVEIIPKLLYLAMLHNFWKTQHTCSN